MTERKSRSRNFLRATESNAHNILRELYMGACGKGTKNKSGEKLAQFLKESGMYATNTTFQKPMRHQTTWQETIQSKNIQSDRLYMHRQLPHILTNNDQSHNGMIFTSNHKMVITILNLSSMYREKKKSKQSDERGKSNHKTTTIQYNPTSTG
jgi:hypothetical protein